MKSLRFLLALAFASALILPAVRAADDKTKDQPAEKSGDCTKDKDGKACGQDKDGCCTGEKAKPVEKKDGAEKKEDTKK